jgi:hypothetical protein
MNELKINENVSQNDREIINTYWSFTEDGELAIKPTKLAQKHGISLYQLQQILKANSEFIVDAGYCKSCITPVQDVVTSHTAYRASRSLKMHRECMKCAQITYEKREEEHRLYLEKQEQIALENAKNREAENERIKEEIKEINCNYEAALNLKTEKGLSWEDLKTLLLILKYRTKDQIYNKVFCGNSYNRDIWDSVNSLEKKKLLKVIRAANKSVIEFQDFKNLHEMLIVEKRSFFSNINNSEGFSATDYTEATKSPNTTLRFSLQRSENKTHDNQPDYRGTFTLKQDIVLQEGVKYIYGGWINNDGNISLNFQPSNEIIQRPKQSTFEDEPEEVQEQISNLDNDIFGSFPPF